MLSMFGRAAGSPAPNALQQVAEQDEAFSPVHLKLPCRINWSLHGEYPNATRNREQQHPHTAAGQGGHHLTNTMAQHIVESQAALLRQAPGIVVVYECRLKKPADRQAAIAALNQQRRSNPRAVSIPATGDIPWSADWNLYAGFLTASGITQSPRLAHIPFVCHPDSGADCEYAFPDPAWEYGYVVEASVFLSNVLHAIRRQMKPTASPQPDPSAEFARLRSEIARLEAERDLARQSQAPVTDPATGLLRQSLTQAQRELAEARALAERQQAEGESIMRQLQELRTQNATLSSQLMTSADAAGASASATVQPDAAITELFTAMQADLEKVRAEKLQLEAQIRAGTAELTEARMTISRLEARNAAALPPTALPSSETLRMTLQLARAEGEAKHLREQVDRLNAALEEARAQTQNASTVFASQAAPVPGLTPIAPWPLAWRRSTSTKTSRGSCIAPTSGRTRSLIALCCRAT